ncbi:MAG TPA: GTP 3',8-cyclase MoaA [Spirochaetota bacterium]|nr:GTP 3',8-cyclase MoaA [Spirochaetota bacterium]HPI90746.1 GTP 3',8-cyclase MoaA [Spirochaetota bacterium]HPR46350.1 GTP 3',8-cyclase MoaA [Spirochaetota bacterium]
MLHDSFLRKHNYLRVSITDKCNLRCRYCMPPGGVDWLDHDEVLRNEEFSGLISLFVSMGVGKIRFTGGEPLIRKGFIDIVEQVRANSPDLELCLTTNGVLLENYLPELHRLGLKNINISLDTLSAGRYADITTVDAYGRVIRAIDRASSYGFFSIKINAVLFEETLDEIDAFLDFAAERNVILRFIERMPFTEDGLGGSFLPANRLVSVLETRGKLERDESIDTNVAMMYRISRGGRVIKLGIIPPMTHKFCHKCNRLRLTSNGRLKTCLYSSDDVDLMGPLRKGVDSSEVIALIRKALMEKKPGHSIDCCNEGGCQAIISHSMSRIGG